MTYPRFKWAKFNSKEYLQAINEINDMYRKMIMIGKSREVFHDKVCPMISAKTRNEFKTARNRIRDNYWRYSTTSKTLCPSSVTM